MKKIAKTVQEYQRNFFDERKKLDEREKNLDEREKQLDKRENKIKNESLEETLARSKSQLVIEKAEKWDCHVAQQQRNRSRSR